MTTSLSGRRIALLITHGAEWDQVVTPRRVLQELGAVVHVVSPAGGVVDTLRQGEAGPSVPVDVELRRARADDYDALYLPGGILGADALRVEERATALVCAFVLSEKPVAALAHGVWLLVEAGAVALAGRTVTSAPSIKSDVQNAGGLWVDQAVSREDCLVTGRTVVDLDAFTAAMGSEFARPYESAQSVSREREVPSQVAMAAAP